MAKAVSVIGSKKSGKTTTVEYLVKHLVKEGFRVGCVKHVHDEGFTIDTEGKDTWRFARAGANIVVSVAPDEVSVIRKTREMHQNLDGILSLFKGESLDIIILEGFHALVADRRDIYKIITAKDEEDLRSLLEGTAPPILAVTGVIGEKNSPKDIQLPVVNISSDGEYLVRLLKDLIRS